MEMAAAVEAVPTVTAMTAMTTTGRCEVWGERCGTDGNVPEAHMAMVIRTRLHLSWDHPATQVVAITGSFFVCLNDDGQATDQEKRLFAAVPRPCASSPAR